MTTWKDLVDLMDKRDMRKVLDGLDKEIQDLQDIRRLLTTVCSLRYPLSPKTAPTMKLKTHRRQEKKNRG